MSPPRPSLVGNVRGSSISHLKAQVRTRHSVQTPSALWNDPCAHTRDPSRPQGKGKVAAKPGSSGVTAPPPPASKAPARPGPSDRPARRGRVTAGEVTTRRGAVEMGRRPGRTWAAPAALRSPRTFTRAQLHPWLPGGPPPAQRRGADAQSRGEDGKRGSTPAASAHRLSPTTRQDAPRALGLRSAPPRRRGYYPSAERRHAPFSRELGAHDFRSVRPSFQAYTPLPGAAA